MSEHQKSEPDYGRIGILEGAVKVLEDKVRILEEKVEELDKRWREARGARAGMMGLS